MTVGIFTSQQLQFYISFFKISSYTVSSKTIVFVSAHLQLNLCCTNTYTLNKVVQFTNPFVISTYIHIYVGTSKIPRFAQPSIELRISQQGIPLSVSYVAILFATGVSKLFSSCCDALCCIWIGRYVYLYNITRFLKFSAFFCHVIFFNSVFIKSRAKVKQEGKLVHIFLTN